MSDIAMTSQEMEHFSKVHKAFVEIARPHAPVWFWNPEVTTLKVGHGDHTGVPYVYVKTPFSSMCFVFVGFKHKQDCFTLYEEGSSVGLRGSTFEQLLATWKEYLSDRHKREQEELETRAALLKAIP